MHGGVTVAERGSETDALGCDVLLIAVLPVEVDDVFDGPEVAGFVVVSGGIFDVVESELVAPAVVTAVRVSVPARWKRWSPLPWACFSPQSASTRVASRLSTIDSTKTASKFCSVTNSASVASGIVLSSSMLIVNRTWIVACMGHLSGWTPEVTPSSRESVATEL